MRQKCFGVSRENSVENNRACGGVVKKPCQEEGAMGVAPKNTFYWLPKKYVVSSSLLLHGHLPLKPTTENYPLLILSLRRSPFMKIFNHKPQHPLFSRWR
jgi:hypothetical protein